MKLFLLALVLGGCGSVSGTQMDASPGGGSGSGSGSGDMIDAALPACGTAGAACCANNACSAGLSCTTTDQVCRAATVFIGGGTANGFDGTAYVAIGSGTTFTETPLGTGVVGGIWGTSATDVWAIVDGPTGANGQTSFARHWNGTAWGAAMPFPAGSYVYGIWGDSPNNYWAVSNAGAVYHWTGTAWSAPMTIASGAVLSGIWGSSASDVWTIAGGQIAHFDGTVWNLTTRAEFNAAASAISGRKATGELIIGGSANGQNGTQVGPSVLHRIGANLTVEHLAGDGSDCHDTRAVWMSQTDAYAITNGLFNSGACTNTATYLHSTNTTWSAWTPTPASTVIPQTLWGTSNKDMYITSGASVLHFDGTAWTPAYTATQATSFRPMWSTGSPN